MEIENLGTLTLSMQRKIISSVQLQMDLGSGPIARQSAQIIPNVLKEHHHESIDELLSRCNEHMVQKRGAAVAIVKVDYKKKTIQYSCVGNVRFYMLQDRDKDDLPLTGYGLFIWETQKLKTQQYDYQEGRLVLSSFRWGNC